jgi:pyruvate/2-oxoglutarate/acetoin dehydrogenase E1 component
LKVVVPSMPADAKGALKSAIRGPTRYAQQKKVYRLVAEEVRTPGASIPHWCAKDQIGCFAWGS